jgi:hypothetical protein
VTLKPLPAEFRELQDLAETWSLPTEVERQSKRLVSPMSELQAAYDRLVPRAEAILEYMRQLEAKGRPKELSAANRNLVFLVFSLVEIAQAIEVHGQPGVVDGFDAKRWVAEHDTPAARAFEQRVRPKLI